MPVKFFSSIKIILSTLSGVFILQKQMPFYASSNFASNILAQFIIALQVIQAHNIATFKKLAYFSAKVRLTFSCAAF